MLGSIRRARVLKQDFLIRNTKQLHLDISEKNLNPHSTIYCIYSFEVKIGDLVSLKVQGPRPALVKLPSEAFLNDITLIEALEY